MPVAWGDLWCVSKCRSGHVKSPFEEGAASRVNPRRINHSRDEFQERRCLLIQFHPVPRIAFLAEAGQRIEESKNGESSLLTRDLGRLPGSRSGDALFGEHADYLVGLIAERFS